MILCHQVEIRLVYKVQTKNLVNSFYNYERMKLIAPGSRDELELRSEKHDAEETRVAHVHERIQLLVQMSQGHNERN